MNKKNDECKECAEKMKELEELKKADEGTLPWYKRILRHE